MPHNYIFGRQISHQFVENQPEEKFGGHAKVNNIVGMKRKESWIELEAGNFEMQQEYNRGPTVEKKFKISPEDPTEVQHEVVPNCIESPVEHVPHQNSPQFCQSMVAHMAVSFGTKNESVPNHPISNQPEILENNATAVNDDERPCDMEMDCAMATEDHGALQVPEPHIDDTCYRSAAEQEPCTRKPHFYFYRCKPQYYIFH